jgi:hypothetical protein
VAKKAKMSASPEQDRVLQETFDEAVKLERALNSAEIKIKALEHDNQVKTDVIATMVNPPVITSGSRPAVDMSDFTPGPLTWVADDDDELTRRDGDYQS